MSGRPTAISNPYANRKRAAPQGENGVNSSNNNNSEKKTMAMSPPGGGHNYRSAGTTTAVSFSPSALDDSFQIGRTSFSQAFSAVEDSHHFQKALEENKKTSGNNQTSKRSTAATSEEQLQERAQQRAMDTDTAVQAYQQNEQLTDREVQAMGISSHSHVLFVSPKQQGNIVLQYVRNVPTQFLRMVPDYMFSTTQCALFLSLKYHSLYPNYIHRRIAELQTDFVLRVLLVLVDVQDCANILNTLNTLAVANRLTLILSWTAEEAARYLETFKAFQGKDASLIQKRTSTSFGDQVADFLTACPGINKTDAANLLGQFGSMKALATKGTPEELALVPGMGQVKVTRLYEAFCKPFSKKAAQRRRIAKQKNEKNEKHLPNLQNEEIPRGSKEEQDEKQDEELVVSDKVRE